MRAACLTLAALPDATLAEVPLLLNSDEFRSALRSKDEVLRHAGDLRGFWD